MNEGIGTTVCSIMEALFEEGLNTLKATIIAEQKEKGTYLLTDCIASSFRADLKAYLADTEKGKDYLTEPQISSNFFQKTMGFRRKLNDIIAIHCGFKNGEKGHGILVKKKSLKDAIEFYAWTIACVNVNESLCSILIESSDRDEVFIKVTWLLKKSIDCLLYTSDAADE